MPAIAFEEGRHRRRSWACLHELSAVSGPTEGDAAAMIGRIAANADRAAFAMLFEHFAPRVKSYMLRLGAEPQLAEELAQETLLTVWRKAAAFDRAKAAPSTWIFTIARNLRSDSARRGRRGDPVEEPSDEPDPEPAPDAVLAAVQSEDRIREALGALPPEQAQVVRLSFFSDKPHSELADEMQLPLGAVKSRLRLAMGRLCDLLGDLA